MDARDSTILKELDKNSRIPFQQIAKIINLSKDAVNYRIENLKKQGKQVLNIISGGVSELPKKRGWSLENDHIFPKAELERLGVLGNVNDIGNFRLLPKLPNIKKRDNMPDQDTEFFGMDNQELRNFFTSALTNLNQETFSAFVEKRKELILEKVTRFLGM